MKARRFFAFVAGVAMLFGAVGCESDDAAGDGAAAEIAVSPTEIAAKLEGGEYNITVTSNAAWVISCEQSDVTITPMAGAGNATVKVVLPATTAARNFSIKFDASKEAVMQGIPYVSKANASVAVYQNANGDTSIVTNVAEVRALLTAMSGIPTGKDDNGIAVTDELAAMTVTGVVVGEPTGNMGNNYLFAIQDDGTAPGGGLTINHDKAKEMKKGQVVTFSLAGATVKYYYGLLQVSVSNSESLTVVGEPIAVEPIEIAYADFLSYESQYVKINNVTPSTEAIGKAWNSTTKGVNVNFTTAEGQTLVVRVSGYASFKNDIIPSKSGALCGVAGCYNSDKQLMPQYASDIQLTEDIVAPEAEVVTIAQIEKAGLYKVENAWVAGFNGNGPILTDASGAYINTYIHQHNYKTIGQKMTIEGAVTVRQGGFQFDGPTVTVLDGTAEVVYPENPTVYEGEALVALCEKFLTGTYLAEYAAFKGVLEYDGTYYNLVFAGLDGTKYKGSLSKTPDASLNLAALSGTPVTLKGFVVDYSGQYVSIVPTSVEADANAVVLAANAITNVPAEGVTDATHEITVIGIEAVTAEVDGTVVTAASVAGNVLTYSVSANTDKSREGWIKLSAEGVETVTVVVKQSSALAYDFKSDAAFVCSEKNYDGNAKVNGSADVNASGFKIGTGKLSGYFASQPVAVEGDLTLEFYAVAWKSKSATLYVRKQGSTELLGQFTLKANEGAADNSPYTMTVTDEDYYSVEVPGVTANTVLEFATDASFDKVDNASSGRAIVVGVHLVGGTPSTPENPEPEQPGEETPEISASIKSLLYIPTYSDGKATVQFADGISRVTLDFEILPKSAVAELKKVWQNAVSVKAVYTKTRAVSFIDMPITKFDADEANGVITVVASGENLSEAFFTGTQEASCRLAISDGNNAVTSDYIQMVAKNEAPEDPGVTPENPGVTPEPEQPTVKTLPYVESFAANQGAFTINDVDLGGLSGYVWSWASAQYGMKASAFVSGTKYATESWLISPEISLANATAPELTFSHVANHTNGTAAEMLTLWVKESGATEWISLAIPQHGTDSWSFVESGAIDLAAYNNKTIQIGFKYTSTTDVAPTWEVKNFSIAEKGTTVEPEQPNVPASGVYASDAAFVCSEDDSTNKCYTLGASTINGEACSGVKLGTSKNAGVFTSAAVGVEGTKTLSFYGVAWKAEDATIYIKVEGSNDVKSLPLKNNDSVAGAVPMTLTVTESDYYSVELTGLTESSKIVFSTDAEFTVGAKARAVLAGITLK